MATGFQYDSINKNFICSVENIGLGCWGLFSGIVATVILGAGGIVIEGIFGEGLKGDLDDRLIRNIIPYRSL